MTEGARIVTNNQSRPNAAGGRTLHDLHNMPDDVRQLLLLTIEGLFGDARSRLARPCRVHHGTPPIIIARGPMLMAALGVLSCHERPSLSPGSICSTHSDCRLQKHVGDGNEATA